MFIYYTCRREDTSCHVANAVQLQQKHAIEIVTCEFNQLRFYGKICQIPASVTAQEAQLPQRNSASAAHMERWLGRQPTPPPPSLVIPVHMVESESHNIAF